MIKRRDFIKKAGAGMILTGVSGSMVLNASNALETKRQDRASNILTIKNKVEIKVAKPLFCPYYSINEPHEKGGNSYYYRSDAFTHNPFTAAASGMSGSPVIMDANGKFVGFMTTMGFENSIFSFDGKETLTVAVPEGQELFLDESGIGDEAWKTYNSIMMKRLNFEPIAIHPHFWSDVEYCTWSEQKFFAKKRFEQFHLLNHDFVKYYLNKVIAFGYPKGKLTLDHGWGQFPDGSIDSGFGSWVPDPKKFPDFEKTMGMIQEKGFTPGLWIGFPKIHPESHTAKKHPDLLGSWRTSNKDRNPNDIRWLNPKADIFDYASETINRFHKIGVRKFKIDMSYNTKSDMLHIHKELYKAAKAIDSDIEMEFHVPDIFFTKYTDVIRTNDVWLNDKFDWQARVKTHYEISMKSSPGRLINLDHIGGNDTGVITEEKYLKHLSMYKTKIGYPLVSVLPHHYTQKCVDKTGEYLWEYEKSNKKVVSNFYAIQ